MPTRHHTPTHALPAPRLPRLRCFSALLVSPRTMLALLLIANRSPAAAAYEPKAGPLLTTGPLRLVPNPLLATAHGPCNVPLAFSSTAPSSTLPRNTLAFCSCCLLPLFSPLSLLSSMLAIFSALPCSALPCLSGTAVPRVQSRTRGQPSVGYLDFAGMLLAKANRACCPSCTL